MCVIISKSETASLDGFSRLHTSSIQQLHQNIVHIKRPISFDFFWTWNSTLRAKPLFYLYKLYHMYLLPKLYSVRIGPAQSFAKHQTITLLIFANQNDFPYRHKHSENKKLHLFLLFSVSILLDFSLFCIFLFIYNVSNPHPSNLSLSFSLSLSHQFCFWREHFRRSYMPQAPALTFGIPTRCYRVREATLRFRKQFLPSFVTLDSSSPFSYPINSTT